MRKKLKRHIQAFFVVKICEDCGAVTGRGNINHVNGKDLCNVCFHKSHFNCILCGTIGKIEDGIFPYQDDHFFVCCKKCKERNYSQVVSKKRKVGSLQLKKFCPRCRAHTEHKETK